MKTLKGLLLTLVLSIASIAAFAAPVDINTADAQTIAEAIKGVGEKKAQAIVLYREQHGRFTSVDDLKEVKGIGNRIVEMNRNNITVRSENE